MLKLFVIKESLSGESPVLYVESTKLEDEAKQGYFTFHTGNAGRQSEDVFPKPDSGDNLHGQP